MASPGGRMPLSIDSHRAGEITVLTCSGRIIEGAESATLQKRVDDLIAEGPYIILHLGGIEFIDSSGLGLLVRCLIRLESLARPDSRLRGAAPHRRSVQGHRAEHVVQGVSIQRPTPSPASTISRLASARPGLGTTSSA